MFTRYSDFLNEVKFHPHYIDERFKERIEEALLDDSNIPVEVYDLAQKRCTQALRFLGLQVADSYELELSAGAGAGLLFPDLQLVYNGDIILPNFIDKDGELKSVFVLIINSDPTNGTNITTVYPVSRKLTNQQIKEKIESHRDRENMGLTPVELRNLLSKETVDLKSNKRPFIKVNLDITDAEFNMDFPANPTFGKYNHKRMNSQQLAEYEKQRKDALRIAKEEEDKKRAEEMSKLALQENKTATEMGLVINDRFFFVKYNKIQDKPLVREYVAKGFNYNGVRLQPQTTKPQTSWMTGTFSIDVTKIDGTPAPPVEFKIGSDFDYLFTQKNGDVYQGKLGKVYRSHHDDPKGTRMRFILLSSDIHRSSDSKNDLKDGADIENFRVEKK